MQARLLRAIALEAVISLRTRVSFVLRNLNAAVT